MFVCPFTHFDLPTFLNGGAMVPIHDHVENDCKSQPSTLKTNCVRVSPTHDGWRSNQVTRIFGRAFRLAAYIGEAPIWLQRLFLATYVLFCMVLGIWLIVLPWWGRWFEDGFVTHWPQLQHILQKGFVRGAVSGLGLIDIWLGIWEAIHYRDRAPAGVASVQPDGNLNERQQQ